VSHTTVEPADTLESALADESISRFTMYLGLELILAAAVGLFLLGRPSLWLDEASGLMKPLA